jgi:serine/threonine-protein kinase
VHTTEKIDVLRGAVPPSIVIMSGEPSESFPPGTQLGDYRIVRPLGRGASGAVYEVLKVSVAKRMALKVLHRSLTDGGDDKMRFEREAMIAGAIEHPNVVQVFDAGRHEGHYFMTMELLSGETLLERLERVGKLPVHELADLFVPLMSALGAVHDQGIVHRDLKPGNIFLVAKRPGVIEPKLLDFGVIKDLSGIVGGDITRAHSMVGSPSYMSPEQAEQASSIGVQSDQFTVGSILWECLVGRKLFDGDSLYQVLFKIADDPITPPSELRHDVPKDLDEIILRALQRNPAHRFESVRELGGHLLAYCSEPVRALWREEFSPYMPDDPSFDDARTSLMPTVSREMVDSIRASYGHRPSPLPPEPLDAPTLSEGTDPVQRPSPVASLPASVVVSAAPPMVTMDAPQMRAQTLSTTQPIPSQRSRPIWLTVLLVVMVLVALSLAIELVLLLSSR